MSHVPDSAQLDSVYCTVYTVLYSILLAYFFLFIGTHSYQIKHFCLNESFFKKMEHFFISPLNPPGFRSDLSLFFTFTPQDLKKNVKTVL